MMCNVNNYLVVRDEQNCVVLEDGMVVLRNASTGALMKAEYSDAAQYFNLELEDDPQELLFEPQPQETPSVEIINSQADEIVKRDEHQIRFLLNLYSENIANVGPLKRFLKKTNMWKFVAEEISKKFHINRTGVQVLTRYQCVIKRTKKTIQNNKTSGASYKATGYEEEIEAIVAQDDSLLPQFQLGQEESRTKEIHKTTPSTSEITLPSELPASNIDEPSSPVPRKTSMDKFSQKFFLHKKQQLEQTEKLFREAAEAKKLRSEKKEKNKSERHIEKMQWLAEITKRQQTLEELINNKD